jgi:hypothetical protein
MDSRGLGDGMGSTQSLRGLVPVVDSFFFASIPVVDSVPTNRTRPEIFFHSMCMSVFFYFSPQSSATG